MNDSSAANMILPHVAICDDELAREGADDGGEILRNGYLPGERHESTDFDPAVHHKSAATSQTAEAEQLLPNANHFNHHLNDLQVNKPAFVSLPVSTIKAGTPASEDADMQLQKSRLPLPLKPKNGFPVHPASSSSAVKDESDEKVLELLKTGKLKTYGIEDCVKNADRAVKLRRQHYGDYLGDAQCVIDQIPFTNYPYADVHGVCGENIVGYIPVMRHIAGPLLLDGKQFSIPLATPNTALVCSLNRGFRALLLGGAGVQSEMLYDGMTRAPAIRFPNVSSAERAYTWVQKPQNFLRLQREFNSTSRFARLIKITPRLNGRDLYLRFAAATGDAMGMNMVSKGVEKALKLLSSQFADSIETIVLSGNYCIDKKVSGLNWIEGRGKSVACDAVISADVVRKLFNTSVETIVDVCAIKLHGAALFGSVGGFNCGRAADIVAAMFVATGQDVAQVGTSSMCLTTVAARYPSKVDGGKNSSTEADLYISCRMPSLEVGTVGGGTFLESQAAALAVMGVRGGGAVHPGDHAILLAKLICGSVLAGELAFVAQTAAAADIHRRLPLNDAVARESSKNAPCSENVAPAAEASTTTIPLGLAGPLLLDNAYYTVPLATTEGALIASINRGFKAIDKCGNGGVQSVCFRDCMSFGVAIRFYSLRIAANACRWIRDPVNYAVLRARFNNSSCQLTELMPHLADRDLYLQFSATTSNFQGMQLIAANTVGVLQLICAQFRDDIDLIVPNIMNEEKSRSNSVDSCATVMCLNWIRGRGKSVVCDATISAEIVAQILKSSIAAVVQVNDIKNKGSDLAGSVGGFNCQAANIVAAMFLATGQNVAHVGTSALCMTNVESKPRYSTDPQKKDEIVGEDLYISCSMPSLEVGTAGEATQLAAHAGALGIMGLSSSSGFTAATDGGAAAQRLARIICATVLAGELSLLAALSEGTLVASHDKLNRRHFDAAAAAAAAAVSTVGEVEQQPPHSNSSSTVAGAGDTVQS